MGIETNHRIFASQHIMIYPSNGKLLWQGALSLLFLLAGIGIIHLGYLPWIVWIGIPILAFSILRLLLFLFRFFFQMFAPSPMLIIIPQHLIPLSVKQLIEKIQQQYHMYLEHYQIRIRM
jgi:hypothetical protein